MPVLTIRPKTRIYALQWRGDLGELAQFRTPPEHAYVEEDGTLVVLQPSDRDIRVPLDDYLILGILGTFFPCTKEAFAIGYESEAQDLSQHS